MATKSAKSGSAGRQATASRAARNFAWLSAHCLQLASIDARLQLIVASWLFVAGQRYLGALFGLMHAAMNGSEKGDGFEEANGLQKANLAAVLHGAKDLRLVCVIPITIQKTLANSP